MAEMGTAQRLRVAVAEEVRVMMTRRRVNGAGLAAAIGRSQAYVSRRLTGDTAFDLDDLERIAEVLDVPVKRFFPQEGSMSTKTSLTRKIRTGAVRSIVPPAAAPLTGRVPAPKPRVPSTVTKHDQPVDAKRRLARLPYSHA